MNSKDHERARTLLRVARVEGISAGDRRWLDAHLTACDECSKEALSLADAIGSLRTVNATAPTDVVRRTRLAVHRRIEERRSQKEPAVFLWIATVIASVSVIVTTPYTWAAFAWLGGVAHVSDMIWQVGFLFWWFLPATILSGVAGWRHVSRMNWRSL